MKDCKRIIDSVHGNIYIEKEYVTNIVDTPEFQRLRRIEQTSTRAIFPSARHDRFIHSIGVFYMGSLIAKQISKTASDNNYFNIGKTTFEKIVNAYRVACLLHDVGHAPFSHTFEDYYGEGIDLVKIIYRHIRSKKSSLKCDFDSLIGGPKPHELASAILTLIVGSFKEFISQKNLDKELIVRMIIGCQYGDDSTPLSQIKNCFISLLNGEVIDADRLDYACRDVWASGYATSSIDMKRLISGLHICQKNGKYIVCFSSNVLNEIESVLDIKEFQVKYIINHHTVVYEQHLLTEAAKTMALNYGDFSKLEKNKRYKALSEDEKREERCKKGLSDIISIDTISNKVSKINGLHLRLFADDDLVFLMKQRHNEIYDEWEGRQYRRVALWKTRDEFFALFPFLDKGISFYDAPIKRELIDALKNNGYDDFIVIVRKFSSRLSLKDLNICIGNNSDNNEVLTYDQLYRNQISDTDVRFPYVYIMKGDFMGSPEKFREYKSKIIDILSEEVFKNYISKDKDKNSNELLVESIDLLAKIDKSSLNKDDAQIIDATTQKLKLSLEKLQEQNIDD